MNRSSSRLAFVAVLVTAALLPPAAIADTVPGRGLVDGRIRHATYQSEQVYRLRGHIGYQIDLQFEPGESFVGLGAGDIEGIAFVAQDNHLFLKPRAALVGTNLTVLTNRRHYQIDYTASDNPPAAEAGRAIYALRFVYPPSPEDRREARQKTEIEQKLQNAPAARAQNLDYFYCGHPELQPVAASDDGVHTRLRFGVRRELPAIFVRNEDGSESLLNFSVEEGEVLIHRVARQFIVRRGRITGCIVNRAYSGSGERLGTGTIAPDVQRATPRTLP